MAILEVSIQTFVISGTMKNK